MSFVLKSGSFNSLNIGLNDLHDNLNNVIKNKLYNIDAKKSNMDNSDCSTCADSSDLNNLDCIDNLGLVFYKKMDYKQKNKSYTFNVYRVVDYDMFYNKALFNGWLLTSDTLYSCNSLDVPPCSWINLNSILSA